jgi:hypothetical protein
MSGIGTMNFWAPAIDPGHPMNCTQPERYALRRLDNGEFLGITGEDMHLVEVDLPEQAHQFHTHEAALRAARELNEEGRGPVDVQKVL